MSRSVRAVLGIVALAVLGWAGFVWLDTDERGAFGRAPAQLGESPAREERAELRTPELALAEPPPAEASPRSSMLDARPHITGHVRPRGGCAPTGARVVASVFDERAGTVPASYTRAEVARDGSFRLVLPEDAREAVLTLEAEHLELAATVRARAGDEDVVLAPECLSTILGRVMPPPGEADANLVNVWLSCKVAEDVRAHPSLVRYAEREFNDHEPFPVRPEPDGFFALHGLPTGIELELSAKHPWGPPWKERLAPLMLGEERELVLALDAGLTLAGRVEDEHGSPVAGVSVFVSIPGGDVGERNMETGADGRFRFARLERRSCNLAVRDGEILARGAKRIIDGTTDVPELVLTVVRGGFIGGTVVWTSGEPAMADLRIQGSSNKHGTAFSNGAFEVRGLAEDSYVLEASAKRDGVLGKARLEGVRPGQHDLRIVLEPQAAFELAGTVVDESGEPVPVGEVSAYSGEDFERARVADGRFAFRDLTAGSWTLEVEAKGFLSTSQDVSVGPSAGALRFVLRR